MKWDCEMIQDLLPLYVDEVCSKQSAAAVKEHLSECEACRVYEQELRQADFTAEKMDQTAIDGFKKVRRKMQRQQLAGIFLAALLLMLGFFGFWGNTSLSVAGYSVLLILCMAVIYQFGGETKTGFVSASMKKRASAASGPRNAHGTRADVLLVCGSVLLTVGTVSILMVALSEALAGAPVLGAAPEKSGPLLANIWAVGFILQLVLLFILWRRQRMLHIENRPRACVCVMGMFLLLAYVSALRHLDTFEQVGRRFAHNSLAVLLPGAVGTAVIWMLCRKKDRLS